MTASGLAAWLFVIIWASGFVVARGISGLVDPYLFLLVRFLCVLLVFSVAMVITRSPIPTARDRWRLLGIGGLMQGFYLGPGFWAVSEGLPAGVMALIGAMQPPLTALLAWYFLNERINRLTLIGLFMGIAGVALAVSPGLTGGSLSGVSAGGSLASSLDAGNQGIGPIVIAAALLSIGSITAATLLQKSSIVSIPLLSTVTFQTLGAVLVMLIMTLLLGELHWPSGAGHPIGSSAEAFAYLGYAVFVLSIGGFTLLTWLVRTGSATRASSLLLVVPPLAALMSWWLYGEALGLVQISGFVLALLGVVLARRVS